jgi:hypothetical protein
MKTDLTKARGRAVFPMYWLVYFCLIGYSALVVLNTGDIGFQGDDFWYLTPFFHGFWQAFLDYALQFDRPFGYLYAFSLFKLFGFSRLPYLALDFFLQATTSLFFGLILAKVFPRQRVLIFFSMLFSFFLEPSGSSLFVMQVTTARLGTLLFWLSVFMFQWWAQKPFWLRLLIPVLLYYISTLFYDATSPLILTTPLFVYPVWYRTQNNAETSFEEMYTRLFTNLRLSITGKTSLLRLPETAFIIKLAVGLLICIVLLLINLFILFPYGGSRIHTSFSNLSLIPNYLLVLLRYLIIPFSYVSFDILTWTISVLLFVFLLMILFRGYETNHPSGGSSGDTSWQLYAIIMGLAIFCIGIFPYIMARYTAQVGFIMHGRVFFSAIYGYVILYSVIIASWKSTLFRRFLEVIGVILIVANAAFLADLRLDWRSAALKNCTLWSSVIEQVPAVKHGTIFLFVDLQTYYQDGKITPEGNRATVFTGVDILPLYLEMIYGDDSLRGYYVYPSNMKQSLLQSEGRTAIVTANGVIARGSQELPKDKLVILQRQGDRLILVDKLTASDGTAAIVWKDGVNELVSNRDQIIRGDISSERYEIIWGHACR